MQTPEPLPQMGLAMTNRAVSWLYDVRKPGQIDWDIDQPYQRGHVWGLTRRRNLIRSLIMGVPIPSLVINDRSNAYFHEAGYGPIRDSAWSIIDGKQRATTYAMFGADQFAIPASWFAAADVDTVEDTPDGLYVRHSGLSRPGRLRFDRHQVGISQGRLSTLADERLIFDLVNFGGVAQGETDDEVTTPDPTKEQRQ